jgi:hypothetical protein
MLHQLSNNPASAETTVGDDFSINWETVERLRQSAIIDRDRLQAEGRAAGRQWGAAVAEEHELRRAAGLYAKTRGNTWFCDDDRGCEFSVADLIAAEIAGTSDEVDRGESKEFWRDVADGADCQPNADWARGFLKGVVDVWDAYERAGGN